MNLLDYVILAVFAIFILNGLHKGFLTTALSVGALLLACTFALIFRPVAANNIMENEELFSMMHYYTEGAEAIGNVELARTDIEQLSSAEITEAIAAANLPYPVGKAISFNIARESFAENSLYTLGDYFNESMVHVFTNIVGFLIVFLIVRLILAFILHGIQYAYELPSLRLHDGKIGAAVGLVHAVLALFVLFMLVPLVLTVLPFEPIRELVDTSFFAPFFYRSNFLLSLMPGV